MGAVIRNRTQHHQRVSWRVRRVYHKRLKYPVLTPNHGYQTSNASFWYVTTVLYFLGEKRIYNPGYQKSDTPLWYVTPVLKFACTYKDWFFTGSFMKPDGYWRFWKGVFHPPPPTWQFFANTQNRGLWSKSKNRPTLLSTLLTADFYFF